MPRLIEVLIEGEETPRMVRVPDELTATQFAAHVVRNGLEWEEKEGSLALVPARRIDFIRVPKELRDEEPRDALGRLFSLGKPRAEAGK